ncbi:MAG: RNA polymerase sigma factor [Chloroflexota bacterium]
MSDIGDPDQARPMAPVDDTDEEILARVAGGQMDALERLYDRYRSMAYAIALRITADPGSAEDVVQDAFLDAWRNAARYAVSRGSVRTWLLSIVHHRAIDSIRRRRPTSELPEGEGATPAPMTLPDIWPEVAGNLDRTAIAAALGGLTPAQREAIELAYFGGLTQQEIAARTGAPLGTVKSRVRLGLLALRAALCAAGEAPTGSPGEAGR